MAGRLVFVHGRAQQGLDAIALKASWTQSLRRGLEKSKLTLSIQDEDIKFPYYGQCLFDHVSGKPEEEIAEVIVRGMSGSPQEREFMVAALTEIAAGHGVSPADINAASTDDVNAMGIQNSQWVLRILSALDSHVPYASAAAIAIALADVYQYLYNDAVTTVIDTGVRAALAADVPTVVVAHSLGSVVTYKLLKDAAASRGVRVPLLVTLGSPLAVRAIRKRLQPIKYPACVAHWFNALDPRDVVSLYPLTPAHFAVDREIENKADVDNFTENRHSIEGYLEDAIVARRIADALAS
jgi:hypothetical protein